MQEEKNQSIASNAQHVKNAFIDEKTSLLFFCRLRSLRNYCDLFVKILVTRRFDTVFCFFLLYILFTSLRRREEIPESISFSIQNMPHQRQRLLDFHATIYKNT